MLPLVEQREVMCELNALHNARRLAMNESVQLTWKAKKKLTIHTWCFRLSTGLIEDLGFVIDNDEDIDIILEKVSRIRIHQYTCK
jgi:carbonic anhydrase